MSRWITESLDHWVAGARTECFFWLSQGQSFGGDPSVGVFAFSNLSGGRYSEDFRDFPALARMQPKSGSVEGSTASNPPQKLIIIYRIRPTRWLSLQRRVVRGWTVKRSRLEGVQRRIIATLTSQTLVPVGPEISSPPVFLKKL